MFRSAPPPSSARHLDLAPRRSASGLWLMAGLLALAAGLGALHSSPAARPWPHRRRRRQARAPLSSPRLDLSTGSSFDKCWRLRVPDGHQLLSVSCLAFLGSSSLALSILVPLFCRRGYAEEVRWARRGGLHLRQGRRGHVHWSWALCLRVVRCRALG